MVASPHECSWGGVQYSLQLPPHPLNLLEFLFYFLSSIFYFYFICIDTVASPYECSWGGVQYSLQLPPHLLDWIELLFYFLSSIFYFLFSILFALIWYPLHMSVSISISILHWHDFFSIRTRESLITPTTFISFYLTWDNIIPFTRTACMHASSRYHAARLLPRGSLLPPSQSHNA